RSVGEARDRGQSAARLSARRDERRSVDAELSLLSGDWREYYLQQDGAVVEHDGALARLAGRAARPVNTFRPLEVQTSAAAGFLRHRVGSDRAGSQLVLRSGVPQLQRLRLRRPGAD